MHSFLFPKPNKFVSRFLLNCPPPICSYFSDTCGHTQVQYCFIKHSRHLNENPVIAGDRQEPKLIQMRFSHKNEEQVTITTSNLTL